MMTVKRTPTRKEVRSYDYVDHRSVSVERHCGTHVYRAICGPRVDEATRVDLKKGGLKRMGGRYTRADGEQAPPARVKIIFRSRQTGKPRHHLAATVTSSH
jgi:hypothetical protein